MPVTALSLWSGFGFFLSLAISCVPPFLASVLYSTCPPFSTQLLLGPTTVFVPGRICSLPQNLGHPVFGTTLNFDAGHFLTSSIFPPASKFQPPENIPADSLAASLSIAATRPILRPTQIHLAPFSAIYWPAPSLRFPPRAFSTFHHWPNFSATFILRLTLLSTLSHFLSHLPKSPGIQNDATSTFRTSPLNPFAPICTSSPSAALPAKPAPHLFLLRAYYRASTFLSPAVFSTAPLFPSSSNFPPPVFFPPGHFQLPPVFSPAPFFAGPPILADLVFRRPLLFRPPLFCITRSFWLLPDFLLACCFCHPRSFSLSPDFSAAVSFHISSVFNCFPIGALALFYRSSAGLLLGLLPQLSQNSKPPNRYTYPPDSGQHFWAPPLFPRRHLLAMFLLLRLLRTIPLIF